MNDKVPRHILEKLRERLRQELRKEAADARQRGDITAAEAFERMIKHVDASERYPRR